MTTPPNEFLLQLPDEAGIAEVAMLKGFLDSPVRSCRPMALDASACSRVDVAVLQLIAAAAASGASVRLLDGRGVIAAEAARNGLQTVVSHLIQKENA